jgi:hypothetical protein
MLQLEQVSGKLDQFIVGQIDEGQSRQQADAVVDLSFESTSARFGSK